jgi:predicted GNAT superfamily acetyltransferase
MSDAREVAARAAVAAGVRIAPLDGLTDGDAVNAVIADVWGEQFLGPELLRAFQHAGSPFLGAWDEGRGPVPELVGFVLGFVGVEGGLHVHSHMLAVLPDRRRRGTGLALKLAQRAWAIETGIPEIRWTFDPMLLGNARFNLIRLGGVATAFLPNFYGAMGDELNRGERTDRFELVWATGSDRVRVAVDPGGGVGGIPPAPVLVDVGGDADLPHPIATDRKPGDRALVAIPADHLRLRRSDPALAVAWREAAGAAFRACFEHGLVATSVTEEGRYLFERRPG